MGAYHKQAVKVQVAGPFRRKPKGEKGWVHEGGLNGSWYEYAYVDGWVHEEGLWAIVPPWGSSRHWSVTHISSGISISRAITGRRKAESLVKDLRECREIDSFSTLHELVDAIKKQYPQYYVWLSKYEKKRARR